MPTVAGVAERVVLRTAAQTQRHLEAVAVDGGAVRGDQFQRPLDESWPVGCERHSSAIIGFGRHGSPPVPLFAAQG